VKERLHERLFGKKEVRTERLREKVWQWEKKGEHGGGESEKNQTVDGGKQGTPDHPLMEKENGLTGKKKWKEKRAFHKKEGL